MIDHCTASGPCSTRHMTLTSLLVVQASWSMQISLEAVFRGAAPDNTIWGNTPRVSGFLKFSFIYPAWHVVDSARLESKGGAMPQMVC